MSTSTTQNPTTSSKSTATKTTTTTDPKDNQGSLGQTYNTLKGTVVAGDTQ